MGQSIRATAAAGPDWPTIPPGEAGFTSELEALLDKAITGKRVWNLHGVVIVRHEAVVLERYFAGEDDARGHPLGRSPSTTIPCMTCVRYRRASLACSTASHSPAEKCRRPRRRSSPRFPNTPISLPIPREAAGQSIMC